MYNEGHAGQTRENCITMEFLRRLWNEALFLLQIEDKLRYYTFIYSFQRWSLIETRRSYFFIDAWKSFYRGLHTYNYYDIETF